jgi:hypothetical protein
MVGSISERRPEIVPANCLFEKAHSYIKYLPLSGSLFVLVYLLVWESSFLFRVEQYLPLLLALHNALFVLKVNLTWFHSLVVPIEISVVSFVYFSIRLRTIYQRTCSLHGDHRYAYIEPLYCWAPRLLPRSPTPKHNDGCAY